MIKPLAVKKNKYGQLVADISAADYYAQIMEEVLEAQAEFVKAKILRNNPDDCCGNCFMGIKANEAEELVDVITCCVTRLDIIGGKYDVEKVELPKDFYRELSKSVLIALRKAFQSEVSQLVGDYEAVELSFIINLCIARLEQLGYYADKRQELYKAVNEKNRKRGYFEE